MSEKITGLSREKDSMLKNAGYNAYNIQQAVEAGNDREMVEKISEINGFGPALASRVVFNFN